VPTSTRLTSGSWRVQVGRKRQYVANTFIRRCDAEEWVIETERSIDRGAPIRRSLPHEYGRHQPLNRQSERDAREAVDLSLSWRVLGRRPRQRVEDHAMLASGKPAHEQTFNRLGCSSGKLPTGIAAEARIEPILASDSGLARRHFRFRPTPTLIDADTWIAGDRAKQ